MGLLRANDANALTPELANRLIDFFTPPGKYAAFVVGGGDWNWRRTPDPRWKSVYARMNAYCPWNVGNYTTDPDGIKHAATGSWPADQKECASHRQLWIPVVYPGFSWDNLRQKPPGSTIIPRRKGQFLWEQFHELAKLKPDSIFVAMFDEVDEGTAIFKVTNSPPTQAHFVGYEEMPADWYLRLVREGAKMVNGTIADTAEIPIKP